MTDDQKKNRRKARLLAFLLGALLGVGCLYVPEDYQVACETASRVLAAACGG